MSKVQASILYFLQCDSARLDKSNNTAKTHPYEHNEHHLHVNTDLQ